MDEFTLDGTLDEKMYEMLYDCPEMILYMKSRYQTSKLWKFCIERDPSIFAKMDNPTDDIVEYALDVCGENIIPLRTKFDYINITKRMAFIAIRSFPGAIFHIPRSVLTEEMLDMAFNAQPSLLSVYEGLSDDYLLRRIHARPSDIRYIKYPTDVMRYTALEKDPNTFVYMDNLDSNMIHLLNDKKPGLIDLYRNTLESETSNYAENTETNGEAQINEWPDSHQF